MTKMMRQQVTRIAIGCAVVAGSAMAVQAQAPQRTSAPVTTGSKPASQDTGVPPDYIIGSDDVLVVNVWGARDVSGEVIVRPDGRITLPVGNDIMASGLTTAELKAKVTEELKHGYYEQPDVFIQVKQINSRRVFITGSVGKAGAYALTGPMTIVQLISMAGGLSEFADAKNIVVIRGAQTIKVNYEDLLKSKNVAKNNVELRPGDTVMVK